MKIYYEFYCATACVPIPMQSDLFRCLPISIALKPVNKFSLLPSILLFSAKFNFRSLQPQVNHRIHYQFSLRCRDS